MPSDGYSAWTCELTADTCSNLCLTTRGGSTRPGFAKNGVSWTRGGNFAQWKILSAKMLTSSL